MLYFKKDDYFLYKMDPDTFLCIEVFNSLTHRRILKTVNEQIYNTTLTRIQAAGFVSATAEEFNELFTHVLTKLAE
jgi:hypothetical protein